MMEKQRKPAEEGPFHIDHVRIAPRQQIRLHRQATWELSFVVTGRGRRHIGDQKEAFEAGEVVLIAPMVPHVWHFDEETTDADGLIENYTLTFTEGLLRSLARTFPELSVPLRRWAKGRKSVVFGEKEAAKLALLLKKLHGQPSGARIPTLLQILLLISDEHGKKTSITCSPIYNKEKHFMERIVQYVRCNFNRPISLNQAAEAVGMNRSSFCICFKRATGQTFVSYLNAYRIRQAQSLLSQSDISITDVCYQCGFNDIPYFHRVFKRTTGFSPTAFRNSTLGVAP